MDTGRLREVLEPLIAGLCNVETHARSPKLCSRLGLLPPEFDRSKRVRLESTFVVLRDAELPRVANRYLELLPPAATVRDEIQDLIWADTYPPGIPKRFRREPARALEGGGVTRQHK
jgi:hypothetical protein